MPSNSARVIEMEVTSRLEAMLARIKGIKEISSTSGNGWGRITLELDKHTNIDAARFEASTIVRQTWPDLPKELSYPILEMSRPDDKESRPFMSYTLNASATPIFIQRFAEDQIKPRLSSVQGIYRIDVSGATPMEWRLEYDSRQLRDLGITIEDIQSAISQYYKKEFLGTANMGQGDTSKEWIRLALMPEKITNGFEPSHITVANKDGSLIRLDQLIKVTRQEEAPQSYYRINGLNSIYLSIRAEETANQLQLAKKVKEEMEHIRNMLTPGSEINTSYAAAEFIQEEMDKISAQTFDETFRTALSGDSKDYRESSSSLMFAFILALILIYLILAAQFESFKDPFIIMLTVPLAIAGALIFMYAGGITMNIFSQIGIIMLIGLVAKNGILIVEFANQKQESGENKMQAIRDAALQRLRPILMTSASTVLGLIPLAFATGEGANQRIAMGTAVVGGMLVSTFLTMYIVPAIYSYISTNRNVKTETV